MKYDLQQFGYGKHTAHGIHPLLIVLVNVEGKPVPLDEEYEQQILDMFFGVSDSSISSYLFQRVKWSILYSQCWNH